MAAVAGWMSCSSKMPLPRASIRSDRATRDFAAFDVGPVVGEKIDAPGHVAVRGEILLRPSLPQQAGDAEKGRQPWDRPARVVARHALPRSPARPDRQWHPVEREVDDFGCDWRPCAPRCRSRTNEG